MSEQGVGVRRDELDFDRGRPGSNEDEVEVSEEEQRRQFALSFASQTTGAAEIDILLDNAKKIEDYLRGTTDNENVP